MRGSADSRRSGLGAADQVRLTAATVAGRLVGTASRLARRGSGASIQGQVMLKLDPQALPKLLADRTIAMITGTNGKTTTTHLLAAAVRAGLGQDRLVTNADGANLHYGIASALSTAPHADLAVVETDERVVADMIRLGKPAVIALLNLSRDQMDRHHEIKSLGRTWREALTAAGQDGPVVIANAEDPLVTWAAETAAHVTWVNPSGSWVQDSTLCPNCGAILVRATDPADGTSRWSCSSCPLAQPTAAYKIIDNKIVRTDGPTWDPRLNVPGRFNIGNAAFALASALVLGVDPDDALRGMRTVTSPAGRFGTAHFGDTTARLVLAKNPAGWAEALPLASTKTVVLAIDSAAADGRDVSWLWDVEYEQLVGRTVIATGPRAQDLAVRLAYAGVDHRTIPDLAAALAGHPEPVDVIATYTPFQRLRKLAS